MKILPIILLLLIFSTNKLFAQIEFPFLTGTLKTENGQPANNVKITLHLNDTLERTTLSDANGDFNFGLYPQTSFFVKPEKLDGDDKYKGVTTFDIARISRHILGIEPFTSSYQYIAADVDKNGDVDIADIIHIRNFLLHKTNKLPSGVWRFVDANYVFKNLDPFQENFPETVTITPQQYFVEAKFIAIKMGDVNGTYSY
jgi:Dockerin type I domain